MKFVTKGMTPADFFTSNFEVNSFAAIYAIKRIIALLRHVISDQTNPIYIGIIY